MLARELGAQAGKATLPSFTPADKAWPPASTPTLPDGSPPSLPELIGGSAETSPTPLTDSKGGGQLPEGGPKPTAICHSAVREPPWRHFLNGIRVPTQWLDPLMAAPSWSSAGYMWAPCASSASHELGVISTCSPTIRAASAKDGPPPSR